MSLIVNGFLQGGVANTRICSRGPKTCGKFRRKCWLMLEINNLTAKLKVFLMD